MFLELCGKVAFSQIRPSLFYALLVLPLLLTGGYLYMRNMALQELEHDVLETAKKGKAAMEKKARAERFINRYSHAEPYFLDRHIESLDFLQKEREQIESLISHPALADKLELQKRLNLLHSEKNHLAFIEENTRCSERIKETEEKQRHPVQMSDADLERLLSLIEDIPVGPYNPIPNMPQLIVRDFKIKKMTSPQDLELYEVDMELLKREWID